MMIFMQMYCFGVNNGWIDYCVPQIYWEIGNRAADYKTLITWWNKHAGNRPLYIGEAPRTDKPQSLRELGKGRPHKKGAVLGR